MMTPWISRFGGSHEETPSSLDDTILKGSTRSGPVSYVKTIYCIVVLPGVSYVAMLEVCWSSANRCYGKMESIIRWALFICMHSK